MEAVPMDSDAGLVLDRLKATEAIDWLGVSPGLAEFAKQASEKLFSLTASNFDKAPLKKLYTDRFDAEQIWQQIDLLSGPVLSYIRRRVQIAEKKSAESFFLLAESAEKPRSLSAAKDVFEADFKDGTGSSSDDDERLEELDGGIDGPRATSESEEDLAANDEDASAQKNPLEDEFFKISEMERFLDKADAEENGPSAQADDTANEGDDDEVDLEEAEAGNSEAEGEDEGVGIGYEDFFGKDKKRKVRFNLDEGTELKNSDDDDDDDDDGDGDADGFDKDLINEQIGTESSQEEKLSAHEKRLFKIRKRIEAMEKANLDQKDWTMLGEVTARKRPKNSALEVELDFDHNARPPPVITEEVTASLEDMIKSRIAELRFDDVVKRVVLPNERPKERIELDENKSQKGLGELYESDYMQKTGAIVAPTTTNDALRSEATILFKALCSRLDALSHFSFAPKPVIEDMGIRTDVPSFAMEEVAPLAISEASMLAPEEVFKAEDGLKAEGELTPEERKRRRAQKKRHRKGERRVQDHLQVRKVKTGNGSATGGPKRTPGLKIGHTSFSKSAKVFAALDNAKDLKVKPVPKMEDKRRPTVSALKL